MVSSALKSHVEYGITLWEVLTRVNEIGGGAKRILCWEDLNVGISLVVTF